jgi:hypothetical protein
LAAEFQTLRAVAIGEKAVIADALETGGEGMQQEATDELLGR